MKLTDIIIEFKRIRESLESYNLVLIHGAEGTGKTGFVQEYFSNFKDYKIENIDSSTPISVIKQMIRVKEYIYRKKIIIYDDISIKKDVINAVEQRINTTNGNVSFIVIVNKIKSKPKKFIVHMLEYPTKNELLYYLNKIGLDDNKLKLSLLKLERKSLRVIQMALDDGYLSIEQKIDNGRYHVFKSGSFILSLAIAENLSRLKRFDNLLCEMDKYKKNEKMYKDFVKLYYPSLDRMRLRYPSDLLEIIKNKK